MVVPRVAPEEKVRRLQRHLNDLESDRDEALTSQYTLQKPPRPPGLYWQLRWLAGIILRWTEPLGLWRGDGWPASLKGASAGPTARPFLIWAVGTDRDTLRRACAGFQELHESLPGFVPVLVTDVADFAFFARLGWLVEYLPVLAGVGEVYERRKARFLARLYRGAPVLPAELGLEGANRAEEMRQWIKGARATSPRV